MRRAQYSIGLILLVLLALAILWWNQPRGDEPDTSATPEAPSEEPARSPLLEGLGDDQPEPVAPRPDPSKPKTPPRPWETRKGFDLGTEGEARASGRVVFADGRPAAGAFVWKANVYRSFLRADAEVGHHDFMVAASKTDAEGLYRFNQQQIKTPLNSAAFLARHGDLTALLLAPEDDGELATLPDLVLGPAIEVRIDVVDGFGDAVAGVSCELRVHFGSYGIPALLLGDRSNADGRLKFLALPDQRDLLLEIRLRHSAYPDVEQKLDVNALRSGRPLRITLPSGRTVRGRLVDAEGNPPAAGRIRLHAAGYDPEWKRFERLEGIAAKPEADGEFEVHGVPREKAHLLIYAVPNTTLGFIEYLKRPPQVIALKDGRHGEVLNLGIVRLPAPGAIRGVVRGADGEPVSGVRVDAGIQIEDVRGGGHTKTDAEGRFVIEGLPPAGYRVRAQHDFPGFGTRSAHIDDARPGGAPLEVLLRGASELVLRFHPPGQPDAEASIHGYTWSNHASPGEFMSTDDTISIGSGGGGPKSGPAPGFALVRLRFEPGTHTITFTPKGHQPLEVGPFKIFADRETVIDLEVTPE